MLNYKLNLLSRIKLKYKVSNNSHIKKAKNKNLLIIKNSKVYLQELLLYINLNLIFSNVCIVLSFVFMFIN